MKKTYKQILDAIIKYNNIVILRHEFPDFDACGSQLGLKHWIKENFPKKHVYAYGLDHKVFCPSIYEETDKKELKGKYLCIVVDTANVDRIDGKEWLEKADMLIKIDHHPNVEPFGDICYVDHHTSACAEIIASMLKAFKFKLPDLSAYYLYSGLVGDSGRFQYSSTTSNTFKMASYLLTAKVNIQQIYDKMYLKPMHDIEIVKYFYDIFKVTESGVAYYHVSDEDMARLGISKEQVKAYVNLLAGYNEIKIWVQFTEDSEDPDFKWRVSIRSRDYKVNDVAAAFNGGGHNQAAGCRCVDYNDTLRLIEELDKLL